MTESKCKEVFSERLKELLYQTDLTNEQFASRINITERAVNHYLSGERLPRIDIASEIAGYFNVPLDYLISEDEKMNSYTKTIVEELKNIKTAKDLKEIHDTPFDNAPTIAFAAKNSEIKDLKEHFAMILGTVSKKVQYAYTRRICEIYSQNRRNMKAKYSL